MALACACGGRSLRLGRPTWISRRSAAYRLHTGPRYGRRVTRRVLLVTAALVAACAAGGSNVDARVPTRVVPLVTQTDIVRAYDRLQLAGLRVAVRNSFSARSLCVPSAQRQSPRLGVRVPSGSVVTITAGPCPLGSPGVSRPMPTAVVPRFAGRLASDVVGWADRHSLYWDIHDAPPLARGSASSLFRNYRVLRQRPAPGSTLRPGVFVRSGGTRWFRPTPITVWVTSR